MSVAAPPIFNIGHAGQGARYLHDSYPKATFFRKHRTLLLESDLHIIEGCRDDDDGGGGDDDDDNNDIDEDKDNDENEEQDEDKHENEDHWYPAAKCTAAPRRPKTTKNTDGNFV